MTDALGSVRQLTNAQGQVTLANAYEPYGVLAQTAGSAQTSYGFTGEQTDPSGTLCVYNGETNVANKLESRAQEKRDDRGTEQQVGRTRRDRGGLES